MKSTAHNTKHVTDWTETEAETKAKAGIDSVVACCMKGLNLILKYYFFCSLLYCWFNYGIRVSGCFGFCFGLMCSLKAGKYLFDKWDFWRGWTGKNLVFIFAMKNMFKHGKRMTVESVSCWLVSQKRYFSKKLYFN